MELREFAKVIKKYLVFIIILAAIGAAIGFFSIRFFPSGYQQSRIYFIGQKQDSAKSPNLGSEGYYLQEKLRNSTDALVAILQSGDFQKEAIVAGDQLQVRKVSPQIIRLTYISADRQNATANLDHVVDKFNIKITVLGESTQAAQLKTVGTPQQPVFSKFNKLSLLLAGSILGVVFALFVVGVKEYNKL